MSPDTDAGYERKDWRLGPVIGLVGALLVLSLITTIVARAFDEPPAAVPRHPMAELRTEPAGPLLQAVPGAEAQAQRLRDAELLDTYGWVAPDQGRVRIPVERAMQLALERGLFQAREQR